MLPGRRRLLLVALGVTACLQPPTVTWDNPVDDRDLDGVPNAVDCDDGNPALVRQVCARCGDDVHTGAACDQCVDPKRTGSACDQCLPQFTGSACEMAVLPAGTYQMGSSASAAESDEKPVHPVQLSAFGLDTTEVTVSAYGSCVQAGKCAVPLSGDSYNWGVTGREQHPVNGVSWQDATAYCAWAGKRLPTEAEWEYAARSGGQSQAYPWGNEAATCARAVMADGGDGCGKDSTWPVCSKAAGNSAQGVCDLAGNVWEWVADDYDTYPEALQADPVVKNGKGSKVLRGGSWLIGVASILRAAVGYHFEPTLRSNFVGFRCARTL